MKSHRRSKYTITGLTSSFRLAAKFRNEANQQGTTDNIGAIHSAERILNESLAPLIVYGAFDPKQLRRHPKVRWSVKAKAATRRGERTQFEHVAPKRALTIKAIELVMKSKNDEPLLRFIKRNFRLAVLTPDQRSHLDRHNRSRIDPKRLEKAGIKIVARKVATF
jgi:hypothetical protein